MINQSSQNVFRHDNFTQKSSLEIFKKGILLSAFIN